MPTLISTLAPLLRALYHHHHSVSRHCIHHHIEYGRRERIYVRHYMSFLKRRHVLAARPCHHHQPPPIRMEEPTGLGAHAVTFQDLQAPEPVQGAIRTVQV